MRVAFVSLETTRQADTAGRRRFERVARLVAGRGHDVTVFCSQWWDGDAAEQVVDGVRYRRAAFGTSTASFVAGLPFALAVYRPDIVHVRPTPPSQVLGALPGSFLARAPVVVEWSGDDDPGEGRLATLAVNRPRHVVTPSRLVQTRVRERGPDADQTTIIPESIDFDRLETVAPAEDVDIVYAHPLDESANIDDFLLGLAELRGRDWSAAVVGDGPRRGASEDAAETYRIADRVEFVGACDRRRRLALYRGAHVFVQTALREAFATELLWALACGCVGIVEYQADSSAHELIEAHERGYRVTNPRQLADAIADAGDLDHRTSERRWQRFDHEEVVDQYLELYRDLRNGSS